jgi:hypothetical protein
MRTIFLALTILLGTMEASGQLRYDTLYTRQVGTGAWHTQVIEHTKPWNLHVLEIDLRDEYTTIKSIKAGERYGGMETTIDMARRFDYEGHRVVGAVNADFFSGGPISMQIAQGEFVRRQASGRPGIGFNYRNDVMVEAPVFVSRLLTPDGELTVHGVNESRGTNQIVLYNRFYGASTNTNEHGTEILVESLDGWRANDTLRVVVRNKQSGAGNMAITSGMAVLSGHGTSGQALNSNVSLNDTLRLALGVQPGISDLVELVSGGPFLVRSGREDVGPRGDGTDLHPRTAVGINADTTRLYLITVDGRQIPSAGMTLHELADFMVDIGVHTGINLDGGGSTTMVVRGRIDNRVAADGEGRPVTNALAVISSAPEGDLARVRLRHDTLKVFRGLTHTFLVDGIDENFHRKAFDTSMVRFEADPRIGEISAAGAFQSVASPGSGYVVMHYGDWADSTYVILKDVGSLDISPREVLLDTTRTFAFTFRAFDTDGARQSVSQSEISWSVTDEMIGSVSQSGVFRGLQEGRTGVVATYGDNVRDTVWVDIQLGQGTHHLPSFDILDGWTIRMENVDAENTHVTAVELEDGTEAVEIAYRFVHGSAPLFRVYIDREEDLFAVPEEIHIDYISNGLNHRLFFQAEDRLGQSYHRFFPGFASSETLASFTASLLWPTVVHPLRLTSIGVQLGNTGVSGAVNEGTIILTNVRISYPEASSVSVDPVENPEGFSLGQNYPNPFNPVTTIEYTLDRSTDVTLRVFNVLGQEIARLVDGHLSAGSHRATFDASTLPSGTYFYSLEAEGRRVTRSMVLLK